MKSYVPILILSIVLYSCGSKKQAIIPKSEILYEVVMQNNYLGSEIKFYEFVTEPNEFKMLLGMKELKGKIKADDIKNSNFLILNLGMKSTGGYAIGVERVEEFEDHILLKVKEEAPNVGENVTMAFSYPMCLVKINSKKRIVIE